jgi:iron complex outermembrane receptor protein
MTSVTAHLTGATRIAALLGTASLAVIAASMPGHAQELAAAQTDDVPETVLITGSLIRGTEAVGAPVTNLTPQDFAATGALITADLFRYVPAALVMPGPLATNTGNQIERGTRVSLRGLDTGSATRSLLMVDGMRFPAQGNGQCIIDPSIIPALSLDHIDVLVDGASATYGSDAISGVINIILKRNLDGAITQARWTTAEGGKNRYAASAVWGRTWDGGQITLSYEWYNETPIMGNALSKFGQDHTPWGLDDRRPLGSSLPATLSTGAPGGARVVQQIVNGCTNCYAVPLGAGQNWEPGTSGIGPTAPFSASTLNWSSFNNPGNSGTNGVRNQFDPYDIAWYDPAQERNGGHITVDQRLTGSISFYGSGFYSNRRGHFLNPANLNPSPFNVLFNIAVPTFNPYYPTGGAPNNLRANYNIGWESPSITSFYELAQRYQLGLNIVLPARWNGRIWYAMTNDQNFNNTIGAVNKAAVSAALGWTVGATAATGTTPAIATWTKPANVPYLNLFCDPTAFTCNSDSTLAYIQALRTTHERFWINEKGLTFDGPLFELPGGAVKAAVGATYTTFRLQTIELIATGAPSLIVPYQSDAQGRQVWALFAQVNVPLFSEMNALPGLRRVELEFSWRHDQYSDFGGTSNPKLAFNWAPIEDFTIRGSWGTSFRAPVFGELSLLSNTGISGLNLGPNALTVTAGCTVGESLPPEGSGAWKVMSSIGPGGDGTPGSASVCPSGAITLPNGYILGNPLEPPGIGAGTIGGGGSGGSAVIRAAGLKGWTGLKPELATNWSIGFEYGPSNNFLSGLNLQATYYVIKISGVLTNFPAMNSNAFNNPSSGDFAYLVPTDWQTSGLPGAEACTSNLLPTTCAPFQNVVQSLLNRPRNTVDPQAKTLIMWINDGGTFNKGWLKLDGVDFQASYDWDWGDFGAFNVGVFGAYYLHQRSEAVPGAPGSVIQDTLHTTLNAGAVNEARGVQLFPNLRYRARLGWTNGPWSVTGFVDYTAHYYTAQQWPPDVNGNFCASNGSLDASGAGGTYPCTIDDYTSSLPSYYTFDVSIGYNTLDAPANEYLRNIGVQLVIQNIMDRHGSYGYWTGPVGGPCTCDRQKNMQGRTVSVIVTKQW